MIEERNLIISPHIDDEVLGCFSAINKNSFILYCGCDESTINFDWVKERPNLEKRINELEKIQKNLNFSYKILDNKVNNYSLQSLIPEIEKTINSIKPQAIFIPVPSYNQDHRIVYEAALTALRPHDINYFVKKVFVYEQVQDLWNHNYHHFKPSFFKDLNIDEKIKNYQILESQVRSFRSCEMIKNLASVRGIQANMKYAEAFEILRWVE
jgi:LmbE family N-acetylglucosaminyl deacetylase